MLAVPSLLCRRASTTRLHTLVVRPCLVGGVQSQRWASTKKVVGKSTPSNIGKKKEEFKVSTPEKPGSSRKVTSVKAEKIEEAKPTPTITKSTKTSTRTPSTPTTPITTKHSSTPSTPTTPTKSKNSSTPPSTSSKSTTTPKPKNVSSKTKPELDQIETVKEPQLKNNTDGKTVDGRKPTTPIVAPKTEQEPVIPPKQPKSAKKSRSQLIQEQIEAVEKGKEPEQSQQTLQKPQNGQKEQQEPEQKKELKVYSQKAGDILKSKPQDYLEAIKLFETALHHATEEGNTKQVYSILFAIATTYFKNKDWVKSVAVHKDIAKFCRKVNRPDLESLSITTIVTGSLLSQYGNGDAGKQFLELGLKLANQEPTKNCTLEGMNIAKMSALEGLGDFERLISNDLEKAEEYYKEGLQIAEKDDNLNYKFKFQAQLLLEDDEGDDDISSTDPDVTEDK